MIPRISNLAALVSIALAPSISPCVAQTREMQGATVACGSAEVAAVADSVAAAFDAHQFVFIGSTHGGKKAHDFLLCLLSRPAFQQRVTDVLVEWANPVHQTLMDRYLLTLDQVPEDSLRQVWFDTDYPQLWARLPQIPEFFAAAQAINMRLDPARRIRVLGGCEPVNWAAVRTSDDIAASPFKTNWAAHVITEHFAVRPDQRLLVVYGDGHIHHNGGTLMSDLEAKLDRAKLFVIGTISDLDAGESERVALFGDPTRPSFIVARNFPSSRPYPKDLFYAGSDLLASHVDAVAYLGPDPDRDLSNSIELTEAQRAELARRDGLKGDLRRLMQLRFGHRDIWFRTHPNDIPKRLSRDTKMPVAALSNVINQPPGHNACPESRRSSPGRLDCLVSHCFDYS